MYDSLDTITIRALPRECLEHIFKILVVSNPSWYALTIPYVCQQWRRISLTDNNTRSMYIDTSSVDITESALRAQLLYFNQTTELDMSYRGLLQPKTLKQCPPTIKWAIFQHCRLPQGIGWGKLFLQLPNLVRLNLEDTNIHNNALQIISTACPNLRNINVGQCTRIRGSDGLKYLKNLTSLNINGLSYLPPDVYNIIAHNNPTLESLDVSDTAIDDTSFTSICTTIGSHMKFFTVDWCSNLSSNGLKALEYCINITTVEMNGTIYLDEHVVMALAKCTKLQRLSATCAPSLQPSHCDMLANQCRQLRTVKITELAPAPVTAGCHSLVLALKTIPIESLKVYHSNSITSESFIYHPLWTSMTHLTLRDNQHIGSHVLDLATSSFPNLLSLKISSCPGLEQWKFEHAILLAKTSKDLMCLELSATNGQFNKGGLTNECLMELGKLKNLRWVLFSYHPNISHPGLESLIQNNNGIICLQLPGCMGIDDTAIRCLRTLPALYALDLSLTPITSTGVQRMLNQDNNLMEISLSHTGICNKGVRYIADMCPNLTMFNCNHNPDVTNEAILYLHNKCSKLTSSSFRKGR